MPQEEQDTPDDGYDEDLSEYSSGQKFIPNNSVELDNRIIQSHAKQKTILQIPIFNLEDVVLPLLDEKKEIIYVPSMNEKGEKKMYPVVKKIVKLNVYKGYETKEMNFPIADWFNDSVPSSILTKEEARYIRRIDDLGGKLAQKMMAEPKSIQISGFLYRLYMQKNSIADSAKGIGGAAVEKAKTQITKSESQSRLYRLDNDEFEDYKKRTENMDRGIFGLGIKIPFLPKF